MKNTKKRILSVLLAAVMAAAALPVTAMAESLSETAISAEYGAKKLPAPENIKASATIDTITLKWDAVEGADKYRVYMFNEDIFNEDIGEYEKYKDVTKTSCKVTDLKAKTVYKFKVAALVKGDDGKYEVQEKSDEKIVTTKKLPQPSSVGWSSEKNSITVNWSSVDGADRYGVYVRKQNEGEFEKFKTTSKTNCKITGLSAGTSYDVKIVALTEKADGSYTKQTDDDYRSGLSTKKTSSTQKTSSSKNETGAGGYPQLPFCAPGWDRKEFLEEKGDQYPDKTSNSRGGYSYGGYFAYSGEVVYGMVAFDSKGRLYASGFTRFNKSLSDFHDLVDEYTRSKGRPVSSELYKRTWRSTLLFHCYEQLIYDSSDDKIQEIRIYDDDEVEK